MLKISLIIPCYNSAATIRSVTNELIATVTKQIKYDYEIILVNDCSRDDTLNVLSNLAKNNNKIKVLDLARNFGQHAAIMAGLHYVSGDIIVCLDDDGQTPANEAFKLIHKIEAGSDVVFAKYQHKKHSLFRNFGSKLNDIMANYLLNKPKEIVITSFFACKHFIAEEIIKYNNPYPYISGLLIRSTNNISNVNVTHRLRIHGKSGYTMHALVQLWLNGFTAFSVKPLRIATIAGCIFALCGFIYAIIIVVKRICNPNMVLGYSSLMAALLFIGGILMLMLGIIGEYLGRIYISLNKSPQFVIKEKINI